MIEFDTWTNDRPNTINVKWYRDATQIENQNYTVDSASYFCDTQVQAFNKVVITITNMTKPNRFLKIYNIADGLTRQFYNDELENVEIIEQIDTNNRALCINEATLKLLPANNTGVLFQRTLPFSIYRNNTLYGRYFINSSTSNTNKTLYDLKVNDYISLLEGQTYLGGLYSAKSVADLVADIMQDIPYTLDATLGAKTVTGYLPILNKREALRQVAFCLNAFIDTSRSDAIVIKPLPSTVSATVGTNKIISIDTTQEHIVTKMTLETTKLSTKNASADTIFSSALSGTQYILFDKPMFSLSISGGTLVASNINYAIISGLGGTVTLTGKEYVQATTQETKTNPHTVTTDLEKIDTYTTTLTCDGESILNNMQFVEYKIKARLKMDNIQVGDLISLNGQTCRVTMLNYNVGQTDIYCQAQLEAYYV